MPIYNEEKTLQQSIDRVLAQPFVAEIIAVNDASTDDSAKILNSLSDPRIKVMHHDKNQGKGAAIRTGIQAATAPFVGIQDADLEYDPADLQRLLDPLQAGLADAVYGSRFLTTDYHRVLYYWHSLGNRALTLASNMLTNINLTDMETCYKVFKRELIQSIPIEENRFGFEPEITVKLAKRKVRIYEVGISYSGRRRLPLLRWSVLRAAISARNFNISGQLGDGREEAAADFVVAHARQGDIDDVLAILDRYAYEESFLVNVGDEKGKLLDEAVRRADPRIALELGTYCGYGALRIARAAPLARVFSVELGASNAEVAQRIWAHAGVADQITCVVGTIADDGLTLDALEDFGVIQGVLDFLFIDHDKNAYLTDLLTITERGWLHRGSIVVADNVRFPGSPKYRAFMREQQGEQWQTIEHSTHVEYQSLIRDLVLESEYLG